MNSSGVDRSSTSVHQRLGGVDQRSGSVDDVVHDDVGIDRRAVLDRARHVEVEHAVVQVVEGSHAKLETWHHVIRDCPSDQVVAQIDDTPGLELTDAGPSPRIHIVEGSYSSVVSNGLSPNATLSALVHTYIGRRKVSRVIDPSTEEVTWAFPDWSVVVEFRTDASEKVFPMVPAGASNDDLIVHPTQESSRDRLA